MAAERTKKIAKTSNIAESGTGGFNPRPPPSVAEALEDRSAFAIRAAA